MNSGDIFVWQLITLFDVTGNHIPDKEQRQ